MKYVSILLCGAVIAAFFVSCAPKGEAEKEPNNTFSTANTIVLEARQRGYMNTPTDRDYYALRIAEGRIIDIQLSGVRGINLAIKIWKVDAEPKLIKWIDDNRKSSPERLPNLSVTPGTYCMEIFQSDRDPRKENKENAYELVLKGRDAVSEESEPNDAKDEADAIRQDAEITGFFSPAYNRLNTGTDFLHREEDWYVAEIKLTSGTPQLIDLSVTGVNGVNSVLYLYDSDINEIAVSDNGGPGDPETITGAGIKQTGSYYMLVASKSYGFSHDEPYALKYSLRDHDSGAEMEPNNDFDTANEIINNLISGSFNSRDDIDMYLYPVIAPGSYRIELRPSEEMDCIMALYAKDHEKTIIINNGGKGKNEIHPNYFSEKEFYISVASKHVDAQPAGEYVLSIAPLADSDKMEREPNNDVSKANRINGSAITGYISYKGDKDYFLITYDSRVKEKFNVKGTRGGAIKVSITDPLGYIVKSVDIRGDRTETITEMIDKKGYIIIEALSENYDNPYTIQLRGAQ